MNTIGSGRFLAAAFLVVLATYFTPRAEGQGEEHLNAKLVSESSALVPGTTTNLGILLTLEKGWHTYWPGQNDSGYAVKIDLKLPKGLDAQPIQWPAPSRHVSPGDILDHVYEGRVLIVIPVKVAKEAAPGGTVTISGEISFLVCEDACVPGTVSLNAQLPVAASATAPSETAGLFTAARDRLPAPLPKDGPIHIAWEGDVMVISCKDESQLAFFPHQDGATIADLITSGEKKGPTLRLKPSSGQKPVRGVLEVRSLNSHSKPDSTIKPRYYWIESVRGSSGNIAEPSSPSRP